MKALGRWLARLAVASYRRPRVAVLGVLVVTVLSLWQARGLGVDSDLSRLLPRDVPSVVALEELERRGIGAGNVSLLLSCDDQAQLVTWAETVAAEVEQLDDIACVELRRPDAFFEERALYFLDVHQLDELLRRLRERLRWEVAHSELYDLGLDDDAPPAPPSIDAGDFEAALAERFGALRRAAEGPYHLEGRTMLMLVRPEGRASDMGFAQRIVAAVRAAVAHTPAAAIDVGYSGRFVKRVEQQARMERDLLRASSLAALAMLVLLGAYTRRWGSLVQVLAPLGAGIAWLFGFASLVFGTLNILTALIGAVLLGLGIDHGIHLLARFRIERAATDDAEAAVARTFETTGRAVWAAAATTVLSLTGLALSDLLAFREFGVLASVGMTLIVIAYYVLMPALMRWLSVAPHAPLSFVPKLMIWAPLAFWSLALAATVVVPNLGALRFDSDFAALEDRTLPASRLDADVNRILGRSQIPIMLLAEDRAAERRAVAALRARARQAGSRIDRVLALGELVPDRQHDKRAVLDEIALTARKLERGAAGDDRVRLARLSRLAGAQPFTREDLPRPLLAAFEGIGSGGAALIFPSARLSDGREVMELARELRSAVPPGTMLAGEELVLADVLQLVIDEAPLLLGSAAVLVLAVLLWFGGLALALPAAGVALATLALSGALMPLFGLSLDYLNIVVIPVAFGVAVDGAVHLLSHGGARLARGLATTAGPICAASVTSGAGFGALLSTSHPGLRSVGATAVLCFGVNLVIAVVALPAFLSMRRAVARGSASGARWATAIATVLGAGYTPRAPGSVGALAGIPLGLALWPLSWPWRAAALLAAGALAVAAVHRYLRDRRHPDPQEIVVDELIGCAIAVACLPAMEASLSAALWVGAAFATFRVLDIFKPGFIGAIERRWHGAAGVMADDVAAGIAAGLLCLGAHAALSTPW